MSDTTQPKNIKINVDAIIDHSIALSKLDEAVNMGYAETTEEVEDVDGAFDIDNYSVLKYTKQNLTESQKMQARNNLDVVSKEEFNNAIKAINLVLETILGYDSLNNTLENIIE